VEHPPGREPERRYAADVLLGEFLGLELEHAEAAGATATTLTFAGADRRLVLADGLFATAEWLAPASLPARPLARLDAPAGLDLEPLPVLYGNPALEVAEGEVRLGLDVLGGAFFFLTRYEELVVEERDDRGRFPAAASLAAQEGLDERAVVNEYVELLWWALSRLWPSLERRPRAFSVVPSHDVDWPRRPERGTVNLRRAAGDLVARRDPLLAARRLVGPDPYDSFDALMDASERRGLRSAFYFIAGRTGGELDGNYTLDDPWIRRLLRRVHERGHEVGLHPSYGTFLDAEQTRRERDALLRACAEEGIEQDAWGGRQHYLRWRNPETWRNWDEAGLAYDSTLGWPDRGGFRCGVCFEYPVFDLRARRRLALRERPLVAMEMAVLDTGDGAAAFERLRERCRRFGGEFTLLWHNSRLLSGRERRVYDEALG
jgi:hypothetical protein